jgi:Rod binding domain-containing protein
MTLPIDPITTGAAAGAATPTGPAPDAKKLERAGQDFERMLLGQLTRTLIDSALPEDGEAAASTAAYKDLLPDALTEALVSGGGIGLASTLKEGTK